ncbi:MAG: beta-propeller fold lactonase family protein [Litorimonas sp.]
MKRWGLGAAILLAACAANSAPLETDTSIGSLLLVGNKGEDTVSFIDLKSGEELARVSTSHGWPHEIAPSPDSTQAAVVNYQDHHIDIFDLDSRTIVETIDLGEHTRPHGIKWLPDGRIIASTEGNESIVEIALDRTITGIKTHEAGTHMVEVSPDGTKAYTANLGAGSISLIDLNTDTLIKTAPAGAGTEGIDLTPDGTELWISNREANTVIVYNAATLDQIDSLEVGAFPIRLQISPNGRYAVTSNLQDGSLSVIDVKTRTLRRTIPLSGGPSTAQVTILFSDDGQYLYVAETGVDRVAEIDFKTGIVVRRLPAGRQGDGLALINR